MDEPLERLLKALPARPPDAALDGEIRRLALERFRRHRPRVKSSPRRRALTMLVESGFAAASAVVLLGWLVSTLAQLHGG